MCRTLPIVVTLAPGKTLEKLQRHVRQGPEADPHDAEHSGACAGRYDGPLPRQTGDGGRTRQGAAAFSARSGKRKSSSEAMMDAVVAVSGSSPAYVFLLIEAMADAAVMGGIPREKAYTFAAQSVLGSAKMMLETGKHPGELKDMVCSPAGTTIEAVAALERAGLPRLRDRGNACLHGKIRFHVSQTALFSFLLSTCFRIICPLGF